MHKGLPVLPFDSKASWRAWLERNHDKVTGLWLKLAKKGTGVPTVTYEEAREVALAFGWVDGLINRGDETFYLLRFTPRRPRSKWSKINRAIVENLIASGAMEKAGLAEVEKARADGRWDAAYDPPSTIEPHPDLLRALRASRVAEEAFAVLTRSKRFAIITRVNDLKREETRRRRIAEIVEALARGEVP